MLSAERQSRFQVDVARAHTQRRQVGEAVAALLEAERSPPSTSAPTHVSRETIRDLVGFSGRRVPAELEALATRVAVEPT